MYLLKGVDKSMMEIRMKLSSYKSKEETAKLLKLLYAIELFREGLISIGKAVEIAEMPYQEFIVELRKRDVHAFHYEDEDALKELGL